MTRIAIIGASGEIGARLTQHLLERGRKPRAISRTLSPRLGRWDTLDFRAVDLMDRQGLQKALEGCESIINCAVDKSDTTDVTRSVQRNLEACHNLLNVARRCGVRRIIHLSSIVAVPPRITSHVIDHPNQYSSEKDWYTRVKIRTEQLMVREAGNCQIVVVRPGIVYGPYMHWSRHILSRVAKGATVLPQGSSQCYAVHVDDVVGLALHLVDSSDPVPSLVWAINPEPLTWNEFASAHACAIGVDLDCTKLLAPEQIESRFNRWAEFASWWRALLVCLFRSPLLPERARARVRRARARLGFPSVSQAYSPAQGVDVLFWPSRPEFEMFSSDGVFEDKHVGGALGYRYQIDIESGARSAAAWWRWDHTVSRQEPVVQSVSRTPLPGADSTTCS
jgi:nucleoside-diphosphate-sugar epimerase